MLRTIIQIFKKSEFQYVLEETAILYCELGKNRTKIAFYFLKIQNNTHTYPCTCQYEFSDTSPAPQDNKKLLARGPISSLILWKKIVTQRTINEKLHI